MAALTGCAVFPYHETRIVAERPGSGTNVVEAVVEREEGWASWTLLRTCPAGASIPKEPMGYSYWIQQTAGPRSRVQSAEFLKQYRFSEAGLSYLTWEVRPVLGTNLWLALNHGSTLARAENGSNRWDRTVLLKLYAFSPTELARGRVLETFAPSIPYPDGSDNHRDSIADFRFDPGNQRVTYLTPKGYETYDLLRDTISPSGTPPGESFLQSKYHSR